MQPLLSTLLHLLFLPNISSSFSICGGALLWLHSSLAIVDMRSGRDLLLSPPPAPASPRASLTGALWAEPQIGPSLLQAAPATDDYRCNN